MFAKNNYICSSKSGYSAVRLAHLLWEQGVGSSNLSTPTEEKSHQIYDLVAFVFHRTSNACICKEW